MTVYISNVYLLKTGVKSCTALNYTGYKTAESFFWHKSLQDPRTFVRFRLSFSLCLYVSVSNSLSIWLPAPTPPPLSLSLSLSLSLRFCI